MNTTLFLIQCLNGLQLGVLLFLVAAGLTLVFGVMDFINLAHGVQYMLGAYLAVTFTALTGNLFLALPLALLAALAVSNGAATTLAMTGGPACAAPARRGAAATTLTAFLVAGISAGSALSVLLSLLMQR